MPGLGPDLGPRSLADIRRDIGGLKAAVKFLRSSRDVVGRAALDVGKNIILKAGGSIIIEGGVIVLKNRAGDPRFYLGAIANTDPDGNPQHGWLVYRDGDGSVALGMFDQDAGDGYQQALNWFDRGGNVVLADDTNGGQGVARPYVPMNITNSDMDKSTSSGSWTTLHVVSGYRQHPKMIVSLAAHADAGTDGEVQLVDQVTGSVLGGPTTIGAGIAPYYTMTWPPAAHLTYGYLQIQARVTSGGGAVWVRPYDAVGVQT